MLFRVFTVIILVSILACGCKTTIDSAPGARDVEILSQGYLHGDRKENCREVATFDVVIAENEMSGSKSQTTAQVKARNEAARRGATHVLLWPETEQKCDDNGALSAEGDKTCEVAPVTAYECVIGLNN